MSKRTRLRGEYHGQTERRIPDEFSFFIGAIQPESRSMNGISQYRIAQSWTREEGGDVESIFVGTSVASAVYNACLETVVRIPLARLMRSSRATSQNRWYERH